MHTSENSIFQFIKSEYKNLNDTQKRIARYILENPRNMVQFSITELAEQCQVSEATVSRFTRKLGFKGFQDLKINLAGSLVQPIENIHEEIRQDDDMYMIMNKVYLSLRSSLEESYKKNQPSLFERIAHNLESATEILFFGMGGSASVARDACHKFIRTGIPCHAADDLHWQAMYTSMCEEKTVMFVFSNSGSNKALMEILKMGKAKGLFTVAIVGNPRSPIAKEADEVLTAYSKGSKFRSEAMESRISSLMLMDFIYVALALRRPEQTLKTLEDIRKGIAEMRF
jgi:DNA-binding MurR/RpiR family transcriptional regulator